MCHPTTLQYIQLYFLSFRKDHQVHVGDDVFVLQRTDSSTTYQTVGVIIELWLWLTYSHSGK
jgi:hypothetical protein